MIRVQILGFYKHQYFCVYKKIATSDMRKIAFILRKNGFLGFIKKIEG